MRNLKKAKIGYFLFHRPPYDDAKRRRRGKRRMKRRKRSRSRRRGGEVQVILDTIRSDL